ncbi:MAG: hypothetical protein IJZ89_07150 [Clostridia bacterium]|nr:hypothetical protein [Clostridia bacterium]
MKKFICGLLALMFILSFSACGKEKPSEGEGEGRSKIDKSFDTVVDTDVSDPVLYPVQYIRTDGYRENVDFPYTVNIGSVSELENYIAENRGHYFLGHAEKVYSDTTIGFADATEGYDEAFFESNMLVMAIFEEGSGSNRHELVGVTADDVIQVKRITPEVGTCDMAEWHIILEIPRERAEGHSFTAEYYGEDNRELAVFGQNFVVMSARVPKGWSYDIKPYEEDGENIAGVQMFGLEFYPVEEPDFRVNLYYNTGMLGMCGTGLVSKEIEVNGYKAWYHRYEYENSSWRLYYFNGLPGIYTLETEGGCEPYDKYDSQIEEILQTLELSEEGNIGEEEALELAKAECTVEYDVARAEFDFINGIWRVHFYKRDTAGGDQTVNLYMNGKFYSSEYGE